jgi:hypothetical protein
MPDIRIYDLPTDAAPLSTDGYYLPASQGTVTRKLLVRDLPVDYNRLVNKPSFEQQQVNWNATSGITSIANKPSIASVATSGSFNDLTNKPGTIQAFAKFTVSGYAVTTTLTRNIQSIEVKAPGTRSAQTVSVRVSSGVSTYNGIGILYGSIGSGAYTTQHDRMRSCSSSCINTGTGIFTGGVWRITGGNESDGGCNVQNTAAWNSVEEINFIFIA